MPDPLSWCGRLYRAIQLVLVLRLLRTMCTSKCVQLHRCHRAWQSACLQSNNDEPPCLCVIQTTVATRRGHANEYVTKQVFSMTILLEKWQFWATHLLPKFSALWLHLQTYQTNQHSKGRMSACENTYFTRRKGEIVRPLCFPNICSLSRDSSNATLSSANVSAVGWDTLPSETRDVCKASCLRDPTLGVNRINVDIFVLDWAGHEMDNWQPSILPRSHKEIRTDFSERKAFS